MGQTQTASKWAGWIFGAPGHLPTLPDVETLARSPTTVIRVLGQNPGPATLQGTNTYLVGSGRERVVIDASDGNSYWWPLLKATLDEQGASVAAVVLTHCHYDHTGGLAELREAFPGVDVWRGPSLSDQHTPAADSQEDPQDPLPPPPPPPAADDSRGGPLGRRGWRKGKRRFQPAPRSGPCWCDGEVPEDSKVLADGQTLPLDGARLSVVHTPGHSDDSVCLVLTGGSGGDRAIFTGDTVLGSVAGRFDDLAAYEDSLRCLQQLVANGGDGDGDCGPAALYPGHGEVVEAAKSQTYMRSMLAMLRSREKSVLKALEASPGCTAQDICTALYGYGTNATMAQGMVQQHLDALVARGQARETTGGWLGGSAYEPAAGSPAPRGTTSPDDLGIGAKAG